MIACISPSAVYFEETLSTLNYATRTMNIKNKPVIQMDPKEQIIFNLTRENELLRMENQYLREQLQRASQGLPIEIPDFLPLNKTKQLPPLSSSKRTPSNSRLTPMKENEYSMELPVNKVRYLWDITKINVFLPLGYRWISSGIIETAARKWRASSRERCCRKELSSSYERE